MVQSAHSRRLLAATAVLAIIFAGSCSKKDSVTAPPGGSGAKELDSANLASGAVYRDTFPMADGSFPYHCKIHGLAMSGTVTVAAGGSASGAVSIIDNAYSPPTLTVVPGAIVIWTNNGNVTHTVTSN